MKPYFPIYGKPLGQVEVRGWAPPGLNGSGGLIRMHYRTYGKKKKELLNRLVGVGLPEIRQPAHVLYVRYCLRPMDWDNLGASAKIPFDVLKEIGVIEEDNPELIRSVLNGQEKAKKRVDQGFRIEFWSLG